MAKNYYVYIHRRKDDLTVFFVGHGTDERFKKVSNGSAWKEVVKSAGGFIGEIFEDNLTKQESIERCNFLIKVPLPEWDLIKRQDAKLPRKIDVDVVRSRFVYDESSHSCLRWSRNGRVAGSYSGQYFKVELDKVNLFIHRVIWVMTYGEIPDGYVINHKDCNTKNNKLENLELVLTVNNNRRKKMHVHGKLAKNNTSGTNGVFLKVTKHGDKEYRSYVARWFDPRVNKRVSRDFAVSIYGEDKAKQLASNFMNETATILTSLELGK